uniref:LAGLIDADG endonuclease n=1 Tax=Ramaria rubella TaxID=113071 RepID=UPI0022378448
LLINGLKSCILNKIKDTWIYRPGKKNIIHKLYKLLIIRIIIIEYIQQGLLCCSAVRSAPHPLLLCREALNYSYLKTTPVTNNLTAPQSVYIKKNVYSILLQMELYQPKGPKGRNITSYPYGMGLNSLAYNSNKSFHTQCRAIKRIGPHNIDVISVIFGLLLGDGYANNRSGEGVRISIKQSIIHKEYLFSLYEFFLNKGYCSNNKPREYIRTIKDIKKIYSGYEFNTFTFRSFMWIYELFYKKGKKIVSLNIEKYITPLTLAIWISDDGCFCSSTGGRGGVRITCNSFSLEEVEYLTNVLRKKFFLDCTIQKISLKDKYSIYIKKNSITRLENLILPYLHISMHYKLGLLNK